MVRDILIKSANGKTSLIQNIKKFDVAMLEKAEEFFLIDLEDTEYVDNLYTELKNSTSNKKKRQNDIESKLVLILVTPYQHLIERARNLGIYVIAIWDKQPLLMNSLTNNILANEYYVFDISNSDRLEQMIKFIISEKNVDYIYHIGKEVNMLDTYYIAEKYSKNLNPTSSINHINDKYIMRRLLDNHNLSTIKYSYIENISEFYIVTKEFQFPFVIKPTRMSGSTGVYLCENEESISNWLELIKTYDYSGPFLIEEYLNGPEVSVETITLNGEHYIYGITDKIKSNPPFFVEYGHIHPSQLPETQKNQIEELVKQFLTVSGYRFGPSHTEVIVTEKGPKIVESQARFGGDSIPRLVQLTTGNDMYGELFEMLITNKPIVINAPNKLAMVYSLQWSPGVIEEISGIEYVKSLPYVDQIFTPSIGDTIGEITNSLSRYGYFIVSGNSLEEIIGRVDEVNNILEYKVTQTMKD